MFASSSLLFLGRTRRRNYGYSDWTLAVLAQILFDIVRERAGLTWPIPDHLRVLETRAWTALERALDSPIASPMLWYEEIYFDVAQGYRVRRDPRALTIMKRGLAHCLRFNDGGNAEMFLRDIGETHLWLGELDKALLLHTALIRNEPDNIWHYNSIWALRQSAPKHLLASNR